MPLIQFIAFDALHNTNCLSDIFVKIKQRASRFLNEIAQQEEKFSTRAALNITTWCDIYRNRSDTWKEEKYIKHYPFYAVQFYCATFQYVKQLYPNVMLVCIK